MKEKWLFITFSLVLLIPSGLFLYRKSLIPIEIPLPSWPFHSQTQSQLATNVPPPERQIKVDIKGAVMHPGVYSVPVDARVIDAIHVAGGVSDEADQEAINLAAKLTDGGKIVVPTRKPPIVIEATSVSSSTPQASQNSTSSKTPNVLNINQASEQDLDALPGIGPSKAKEIIQYREKNGAFYDIEQLLLVKGIGPSILEKIRNQIRVN